MKKCIIRNCPAYSCNGICGADEELFCKDCDNCLLKRIAEIFKDFRKDSILINGNQIMVEEILDLLEIEEVNEQL